MSTHFLPVCTQEALRLDSITIRSATIGWLHSGCKVLNGQVRWQAGDFFCFEHGSRWQIEQLPRQGNPYRATLLLLAPQDVRQFHRQYGPLSCAQSLAWRHQGDAALQELWQRVQASHAEHLPAWQCQHRLFELLLHLRDAGWVFAAPAQMTLDEQIRRAIASRPDFPWTPAHVADLLHISISTLQRRLRAQDISFSRLLREQRMECALYLLMSSHLSIGQVALQCGYHSPGKFSAAFKQQFGFSPSQVK